MVNHFFEYGIALFDLQERQLVTEFARIHPSGNLPTSSSNELEYGYVAGTYFFLPGKDFTGPGPEGVINVKIDAIQRDGSVISSRITIGPEPVLLLINTILMAITLIHIAFHFRTVPTPDIPLHIYSGPS